MKVFIRSDASVRMGAGHVMRCLVLAEELRARGAVVSFICQEHSGNLIRQLGEKGFEVHPLPTDCRAAMAGNGMTAAAVPGIEEETYAAEVETILAREREHGIVDWLIIDHYKLDARWENRMRPNVNRIMVIDDLADRPHDCDVLLDQNFYQEMTSRYDGLVPAHCEKLLGPRYALLRGEFRATRQNFRQRSGKVNRILVFFAGADPTNETAKTLKGVQLLNKPEIAVDVVVAEMNLHKEEIRGLARDLPQATFYCQPDNLAELMAGADLSVGASGSTTWERCSLGLPTLVVPLAENQRAVARDLAAQGAVFLSGSGDSVSIQDYQSSLQILVRSPALIRSCSERGIALVDGQGVYRILSAMAVDRLAPLHLQQLA